MRTQPSGTSTPRAVTMSDIAREVGVTHITVHNVLHGKGRVSDATRAKVLSVADSMGYESNLMARSLATGRAQAIGVLAYKISSRFTAMQLSGIEAEAQKRGYRVIVAAHHHDPEIALATLREMSARRLDGVISISSTANMQPGVVEGLPQLRLPYVFSFHEPEAPDESDCVSVDQMQGALLAMRYLWKCGRRRIAFLSGPLERLATRQRLEGFKAALRENGVAPREDWIRFAPDFYPHDGLEAARALLGDCAPNDRPDAFFCASDGLGAAVIRVCREVGLGVPRDVSVIGFDDNPMALACDPPLSSIRMPVEEVGRECVRRLIERIENPDSPADPILRLPCSLVLREST